MYKDNELVLRPIERKDLPHIWRLVYKEEAPEWKQWDSPYYPHASKSYEDFMKTAESLIGDDSMWSLKYPVSVSGQFHTTGNTSRPSGWRQVSFYMNLSAGAGE